MLRPSTRAQEEAVSMLGTKHCAPLCLVRLLPLGLLRSRRTSFWAILKFIPVEGSMTERRSCSLTSGITNDAEAHIRLYEAART